MASTAYDVVRFQGRFPSWEAFDTARQAHCKKTYTMYVCRNTVKVAVANKRRKLQVPEKWVFDRKVYVCTHGYKRVSRSSGSRPRQNVRYTDCKARFTACIASELSEDGREVLFIKVTGQHLVHSDHPLSLEQWRMYSQNRAAVIEHPYLAHEAELLRRVGSSKRAARAHIEALSGKVCTIKDMHNLYARLKKCEEMSTHSEEPARSQSPPPTAGGFQGLSGSQSTTYLPSNGMSGVQVESALRTFVKADVENHVSILSGDDGSNEAICLASRAMKEHFQVFPELMILDVSMATQMLQPGHQLHGFLSMDALGNAKPVFLAQSPAMSSTLLHRVCRDFKRAHPTWMQTKVLAMNKLLPDAIHVLSLAFPETRVLLCQIHVVQLLVDLLACPELPVRSQLADAQAGIPPSSNPSQEKVIESLHQLVYAHSESRYEQVKAELARQLIVGNRRELLAVFDRTFEPYRALWVSYARTEHIDLSSVFTNGTLSFWEPMKNVFKRTDADNLAVAATTAASRSLSATSANLHPVTVAADTQALLPSDSSGAVPVSTAVRGPGSSRGTSFAQKTSEVLTTMKFVEHEWTSKMMMLELTKPVAVGRCDPLLHLMLNCLSSFAVGLVSSQLTVQSAHADGSVTVTKLRAGKANQASTEVAAAESTVRWLNKSTREKHILHQDGSACDCEFFALLQLPCRHLIWYEVIALQHKQLSLVAVGSRWLLRSFQVPRVASQRKLNEIEYH